MNRRQTYKTESLTRYRDKSMQRIDALHCDVAFVQTSGHHIVP